MRESGNAKFCELLEFIVLRVPPVLLVPRCAKHSSFSSPISHLPKLTEGQNLLFAVAQCTVERRSRVILQGTSATYAILRIWL